MLRKPFATVQISKAQVNHMRHSHNHAAPYTYFSVSVLPDTQLASLPRDRGFVRWKRGGGTVVTALGFVLRLECGVLAMRRNTGRL